MSTFASNLRSLKRLAYVLHILLLCGLANVVWAAPNQWKIAPELKIPRDEDKRLHTRTPAISDISDYQTILTALALRHPFSSLWFEKNGDIWVVNGRRGVGIIKIDFELAPLALLSSLRSAIMPYIGQVHSTALQEKIAAEVKAVLAKHGYMNATVGSSLKEMADGVTYIYKLDIGEPCIVRGYKWEQQPPVKVDESLKAGDICSIEDATKTISETENKAKSDGYANANLTFDGFEFDAGTSSAWIKAKGSFGSKIVYEFVDQTTGRNLNSIFSNADMQNFDPAILSSDSVNFELLRQLKIRGYSHAQVTGPSLFETGKGELIYRFSVQLGEVTTISRLQIDGNNHYAESEIYTLLGMERPIQGDTQKTAGVIFNPDAIAAGVERIRAFYVNSGFWNAKVVDRQIQSHSQAGQNSQIVIVISIEEGEQYVFDRMAIQGNNAITTSEFEEFFPLKQGEPLDRSKIVDFQQKVRSYYASKGYFYTNTTAETSAKNGVNGQMETIIVVKIDEGPRVKFGDIFVTGLVKTKPKVVLRELFFQTGEWYSPELVAASRDALLRIGAFSTVIIKPLDPDLAFKKSEIVDLVIQVTEGPTRTVNFGPGWSSYYGMRYSVEAALTNIMGTGRQLFGRASFNEEAYQKAIGEKTLLGRSISAGYVEPYILDSSIDGTLSLSQAARATEYAWSLTRGGELEFSHKLKYVVPGSKISAFYARKLNEEEGSREDVDAFLADTFSVGRTGLRFQIDKRNDIVWASQGYTLGAELSWARYNFGGDLRYFRWEVSNNHYVSILENLVFAFSINFTSFEDIERQSRANEDILPSSERLPAGGADTVRGFKERSLGPIVRRPSLNQDGQWDCGFIASPTGGSRRLILKAETRYRFTSSFATTLFLDSGTSSFSREEMQKFDKAFARDPNVTTTCPGSPQRSIEDNIGYELGDVFADPRVIWEKNFSSFGTALNFLTPIGSINLAYGMPWHEPKSKRCLADSAYCYPRSDQSVPLWRRGEVHFNVGARF